MAPAGPDAATASTAADAAPASTAVSLFPSSSSTTRSTFAASLAVAGSRTAVTTPATTPAGTGLAAASISLSTARSAVTTSPAANFSSALSSASPEPAPLADAEADDDACGGWCTGSLHCVKLCDADEDEEDDGPTFLCARWCCRCGGGGVDAAAASTTGDADASAQGVAEPPPLMPPLPGTTAGRWFAWSARPWRERERGAGRPRQAVRRGLAGRAAREGAGAARTPAQGGRERCGREKRGGRGQRAKLSFYLTSQLKMSSLLDVVCGRLNDPFVVCCEQIRVWRCALHKIML